MCGVCTCTCMHVRVFMIFVYSREKVKAVPEDLKILKANKHYLHATELLTITGTFIDKSLQNN